MASAMIFGDTSIQATLDRTVAALLEITKDIRRQFAVTAVNLPPALFSTYDVGDTINIVAPSFDWSGVDVMARVLARIYNPLGGQCDLIIQEVN